MRERFTHATPHEAIRQHIEGARDWEWRGVATTLYQWTDRFNDRFFVGGMPDALLGFERMDHRILAAYTLNRNAQGLLYEITFNTVHLERPLWELLETLMHEYVHLWQQNQGEQPVTRNYHNREFVERCEALGLHPAIGSGVHVRPADGPFAAFLKAYDVPQPAHGAETIVDAKGRPLDWWYLPGNRESRGRSTLNKWSCGCQNVRVGTKEFHACCTRCGHAFIKVEANPPLVGRQGRLPEGAAATPADESPSPPAPRTVSADTSSSP
ncbi:MAG: SprT-like domain-containing protein [Anaerolineae bacterium]|jgi:hypothetical protein